MKQLVVASLVTALLGMCVAVPVAQKEDAADTEKYDLASVLNDAELAATADAVDAVVSKVEVAFNSEDSDFDIVRDVIAALLPIGRTVIEARGASDPDYDAEEDLKRQDVAEQSVPKLLKVVQDVVEAVPGSDLIPDFSSVLSGLRNTNLNHFGDLSNLDIGDFSKHNLGDFSKSNLGDLSRSNLGDLSNLNHGNLGDLSNVNFGDLRNMNLGDLSNLNHGNLGDLSNLNHGHLGDLSNLNHGNLGDLSNVNFGDLSNMNLGDLSKSNQGGLSNLNFGDLSNINLGDLSNVNLGDLSKSNLGNLGDLSNVNLSDNSRSNLSNLGKSILGSLTNLNPSNLIKFHGLADSDGIEFKIDFSDLTELFSNFKLDDLDQFPHTKLSLGDLVQADITTDTKEETTRDENTKEETTTSEN